MVMIMTHYLSSMIMIHILIQTHPHSRNFKLRTQSNPECVWPTSTEKSTPPKPRHTAAKGGSKCMTSAKRIRTLLWGQSCKSSSWINTTKRLSRHSSSSQSGLEIPNTYEAQRSLIIVTWKHHIRGLFVLQRRPLVTGQMTSSQVKESTKPVTVLQSPTPISWYKLQT